MYFKLLFHEEIIVVPHVWGGLVVSLSSDPQVVDSLPKNMKANEPGNKKCNNQSPDFQTYDYEYYFDCGKINKIKAEQAIQLFKRNYKLNKDTDGALVFIVDEDHDFEPGKSYKNHIVECLEKALNETPYFQVASLFLKRAEETRGKNPNDDASLESAYANFKNKIFS